MPFPLVRYFVITSLFFFLAVGGTLGYFYREMALSRMLQQQEAAAQEVLAQAKAS